LRHVDQQQLTFWLVTTQAFSFNFSLFEKNKVEQTKSSPLLDRMITSDELQQVQIGNHAFINLINIKTEITLPEETLLEYDFKLINQNGELPLSELSLTELLADLVYPQQNRPSFAIKKNINKILHGSCRKPHFKSEDGLRQADKLLSETDFPVENRPSMLMMTGDQIYADDVGGPMLVAIHQTIELLGLYNETWQGAVVNNSEELFASELCYYQRDKLLPHNPANKAVYDKFFAATKKPIFTSVNAKNHLVTLAEVFAMYILVWSPEIWSKLKLDKHKVPEQFNKIYQDELAIINDFAAGLKDVRRALAHIPTYMIFDDHDITDDWNLTRGWEEAAYGHPFSKQIIGNSLIAYWLCQGWGNAPEKFVELNVQTDKHFTTHGLESQMTLIDRVLAWNEWHYNLNTSPKVVVLDTRTQRWRSESSASKPSGLMDWESLTEMQQELINQPSIILVSAAPIYGVKMIETIQQFFSFLGLPLMVDAENWMAHSGTANVMLNIFRHYKTPPNFIILSGDVHYSFVYEVTHRFRRNNSKIFQITCSGLKNQFPKGLLHTLEILNRYLYASYSPLNWFTKRRRMKIKERKPETSKHSSLFNQSGLGQLTLADEAQVVTTHIITAQGKQVEFK